MTVCIRFTIFCLDFATIENVLINHTYPDFRPRSPKYSKGKGRSIPRHVDQDPNLSQMGALKYSIVCVCVDLLDLLMKGAKKIEPLHNRGPYIISVSHNTKPCVCILLQQGKDKEKVNKNITTTTTSSGWHEL